MEQPHSHMSCVCSSGILKVEACLGAAVVAAAALDGSADVEEGARLATVFLEGDANFLAVLGAGLLFPDFRSL